MEKKGVFTAQHCGGLQEMLLTERRITMDTFVSLVKLRIYEFYGYDERLKCNRYILSDMPNNVGLPVWINDYDCNLLNDEN